MSLFASLTEHFGPAIADLYNISPRNATAALRAFQDVSKAVYCGHYAFGVHGWFSRPVSYAAVVREPVARLVSLYHYCQPMLKRYAQREENSGRSMAELWADPSLSDFYLDFPDAIHGDMSAEAFFRSPSAELDNGMVRRFSGWGLNASPCPPEALETAKQNIERHFSVVGVLERYADTLQLLARTYGFATLTEKNVNRGNEPEEKKSLPAAMLQRIRDMNPLDIALYAWVCERFDACLAKPPNVIRVNGNGRKDAEAIPLWRSVGQSPLREAAMHSFGKPTALHIVALGETAFHPKFVRIGAMTRRPDPGNPTGALANQNLMLSPLNAKRLLKVLEATIEGYEKKHGPITK